jgi:hypothetical protein
MMDNDYDLYQKFNDLVDKGVINSPETLRDWAIKHVHGPHNKQAIEDAQEWNNIPEHDRLDHNYESLKDKSPEAADLVDNLGFGPDVSDTEPTLMDPELTNWHEIWQHVMDENEENQQYEKEQQANADRGLTFATTGHPLETNQMVDAYMKYHGAQTDEDRYRHRSTYPAARLAEDGIITPNEYLSGPEEAQGIPLHEGEWWKKNVDPQGNVQFSTHDLSWKTVNDIKHGTATANQKATMQAALEQQGHQPEAIQQIMRQQWRWNPETKSHERLEPQQPKPVDQRMDQPGEMTLPEHWGGKKPTSPSDTVHVDRLPRAAKKKSYRMVDDDELGS